MSQKRLITNKFSLAQLCAGLDVEIIGDAGCLIEGVSTLQAGQPGCITFLANPSYKKYLSSTAASAVILSREFAAACPVTAIVAKNPYFVWSQIAAFFSDKPQPVAGIHPSAVIAQGCEIDPSASIGAQCVVAEGVRIGAGVILEPGCIIGEGSEIGAKTRLEANVTVYHRVKIGQRVLIASGTVVGSDGFGNAKQAGVWYKVPQLGGVVIEDDVEIGANCTIDRGAVGDTVICQGARIDNLVQIAHNVRIGDHTAIAGCVGIAGSAEIGRHCLVGGQAGFAGHVKIADNVMIMGGTEVSRSIREPGVYASGVGGLVTVVERRKNTARVQRLSVLMERVRELEKTLKEITQRLDAVEPIENVDQERCAK